MVCTGFARYLVTTALEEEVPPVTVSPVINFCCEVMKILGVVELLKSSTRIFAVAFEVPPVIVSPTTNFPSVPAPTSRTILLPSTSKTLDAVSTSKRRLSIFTVTLSSAASKYS